MYERKGNELISTAGYFGTDDGMSEIRKPTIEEKLLLLRTVSFEDLTQMTGLSREAILENIKGLRKKYGVKGNERRGWRLSEDPLKVESMRQDLKNSLKKLTVSSY